MSENKIDPTVLVMLGAGWVQGAGEFGSCLSTRIADQLEEVGVLLENLWKEVAADWDGPCWAYEVAEPMGMWLGKTYAENNRLGLRDSDGEFKTPDFDEITTTAREFIADAKVRS